MASYFDDTEDDSRRPFDEEEATRQTTPHDFAPDLAAGAGPPPEPPPGSETNPVGMADLQSRIQAMQGTQAGPPQGPPAQNGMNPLGWPEAPPVPRLSDGSPLSPDEAELHRLSNGVNQSTLNISRQRQLQRLQNGQATVDDLEMNGTLGPAEAEQYRQMIQRRMEPMMIRQSELPIYMHRLQTQRLRMQAAHETAMAVENERFQAQTAQGRMPVAFAQGPDGTPTMFVQNGPGRWAQARPEPRPQRDQSAITPQHLVSINTTNEHTLDRELAEAARPVEQGGRRGGLPSWAQAGDIAESTFERAGLESAVANGNASPEQMQRLEMLRNPPANLHEARTRELARRNRQAVSMLREHLGERGTPGGQPPIAPTPGQAGAPSAPGGGDPPAPQDQLGQTLAGYEQRASRIEDGDVLARPIREMRETVEQYRARGVPWSQVPAEVRRQFEANQAHVERVLRTRQQRPRSPAAPTARPPGARFSERY